MVQSTFEHCKIAGVSSCVPSKVFDNLQDAKGFSKEELRKIIAMAGIKQRHVSDGSICSSDLCLQSAKDLLEELDWSTDSIDVLILITQTPDYFLPSTSCLIHRDLGLPDSCASFDVGLGCSGYPYGLWLASMMINSGMKRILVLHGETPSLITSPEDRATHLLFGDAGSATAVEYSSEAAPWYFSLHTDGAGYDQLIIPGGGFRERNPKDQRDNYLHMNGGAIFNFTIARVPPLINGTLDLAGKSVDDIDYYIFHQSNQFMMKHLAKKCKLSPESTPIILDKFGNCGGPSVPLTVTQAVTPQSFDRELSLMLLGYGVGLSWGSALITIDPETVLLHSEMDSSTKMLSR